VTGLLSFLHSFKKPSPVTLPYQDALNGVHDKAFVLTQAECYDDWSDLDVMKGQIDLKDGTRRFHLAIYEKKLAKPLAFKSRIPLLSSGAQGSPDYLRYVLGGHLSRGLPVLSARIPGLSPVFSAHIWRSGTMPLTFTTDACCLASHFILFVDQGQLETLNEAMRVGQDYDIVRLCLTNGDMMGYPLPPMLVYRSRHLIFAPDGLARSASALTLKSQHRPCTHTTILQMAAALADLNLPQEGISEILQRHEPLRIQINDAIRHYKRRDNLDIFIEHSYIA
jgi:hypothetical protein